MLAGRGKSPVRFAPPTSSRTTRNAAGRSGHARLQGPSLLCMRSVPSGRSIRRPEPELDGVGLLMSRRAGRASLCRQVRRDEHHHPSVERRLCHDRPADLREWEQHEARSRLIKAIDEHVAGGTRLKELCSSTCLLAIPPHALIYCINWRSSA